ncbi:MAG TPA: pirin family protein [Candidatus Baltobacteraceae bacterium]|nr:pirin family protein [Candidatus Baltobacteraceae bacterium]
MRIVPAPQVVEGGGFVVRRPFPVQGLSHVDPFLLIDEMGPVDYAPGKAIGAPDHPHRGFETVTYLLEGGMEHEDSHGYRGSLRPGDVQWMTAGAGVIHSELPSPEMLRSGGRMHGFQIWVNLPKRLKMMQPRYQEYSAAELPLVDANGAHVRIIAGEYGAKRSPIETTAPATMLHVRMDAGAETTFAIAPGSNAIVHAVAGSANVEGKELNEHFDAIFEPSPERIGVRAGERGFEAMVLAAIPLKEPVARYGPFVMNDANELQQAFDDFQNGRFGEIART